MASPVTLCNAVKTLLDGGSYTLSPTIERVYVPVYSEEGLSLTVSVYLGGMRHEKMNRCGTFLEDVEVMVTVIDVITVDSQSDVESMIGLCEEIKDTLSANIVVGDYSLVGIEHQPIFDAQKLHERSLFESSIMFTYRG